MKKTYKPEYFLGGIIERSRDRKDARKEFREEKKRFRKDAKEARRESRKSKKADIKNINQAKKDTIAEIKGNKDLTPAERRVAIREARQGAREDKSVRRKMKRTEIKGIRAAKKLDKKYAKSDKLSAISRAGGIRGKIAGIRERKLDRRLSKSRGRIGKWEDKASDSYYGEGFEDTGGYAEQNRAARENLREEIVSDRAQRNAEGEQQSDVEDRNQYENVASETTDMNTDNENAEGNENTEGDENENETFAGGGFNIKYDEGGMTIKLLKKLQGKTKNPKKKELIQARIEKKEKKKFAKDNSELGFGEGSLREQIKTQHKEDVEEIKKKHEDAEHESLKEQPKGKREKKEIETGEGKKKRKKDKYSMAKKGMKVNEMGHGVLILLGKKSDKKKKK